jgi:hypothetical protein
MKIYKDSSLQHEVQVLDLGIVEAGESRNFLFYVQNDLAAEVRELNFKVEHKEVKVLDAPNILLSKEVGELKIQWNPSITLKEGLRAQLTISGIELWS